MISKSQLRRIARYISNECTEKERLAIQREIQTDSNLKTLVEQYKKICKIEEKPIHIESLDNEWFKMKSLMSQVKRRQQKRLLFELVENFNIQISVFMSAKVPRTAYRFAFIVLILVGGSYWMISQNPLQLLKQEHVEEYKILKVDYGKRITVSLNDGTRITLDAGSELKYPNVFEKTREIILKGEAYFEVAHDENRPFIVHADQAEIQVVGTRFNVRAWEESPNVTVTVNEGKVMLRNRDKNENKPVLLTRDNQGKVLESGEVLLFEDINAKEYLSWMQNEIFFEKATIQEVLAQLKRWYGYEFTFKGTMIQNHNIRIHLKKNNVQEVLELIALITDTEVVARGDTICFNKNILEQEGN